MRSRPTLRPAQPEMCNNVQQYDKKVYLRVSEAQRCRVHSTLVVPLYSSDMTGRPVAIFELVQSEKHCPFLTVMANLKRCLEVRPCACRYGDVPCTRAMHTAHSRSFTGHIFWHPLGIFVFVLPEAAG